MTGAGDGSVSVGDWVRVFWGHRSSQYATWLHTEKTHVVRDKALLLIVSHNIKENCAVYLYVCMYVCMYVRDCIYIAVF